ncbi:MAG: DnaB-like helicase N-terminal domain-containing protein [Coleofasciculus chthonoplastes F3-SA18-01]|uniref:DnaB-like helicase N-terminal domain-containing protein n=1 Tax=Coleofasciculus chthonoplastes TaxID=64178 RepID=UPI0032F7CBD9
MTENVLNHQLNSYFSTLPPQNLEAEEAILGGIMLDPEAMGRVVDLLKPEAFYISAHQEIYRAAWTIYGEDKPTDFMSVTTWLHDHKKLDKVGGQAKIAQLLERTVSAVNIDRYAELVMDRFLRRQLIQSGNEITKLGHDLLYTQEECLKHAQQKLEKVLAIPLKREDKLKAKHKKLIAAIKEIELGEEDPSLKYLKLKEVAKRFRLALKEIDEIWMKYLIYREGAGEIQSFQQLLEQTTDYTKWLMQGLLREVGATIIHAPGGGLKTTIAYDLLYCLLRGQAWESFPVTARKRRVLIIQTDENVSDTIPTLIARGYDETLDVSFVSQWNIQNSAAFNRYLLEFNPDVVLIDSLFSVSSGSLYKENDAEYARPLLQINSIAQEYGKQVIIIHHSNANGGVRGTGAIKASVTAVMSLSADPDHPGPDSPHRILAIEKFRGRCLARYSLEFFAEERRFICHGEYKKQDESSSLKDRIIKFLSAHRNIRYEITELMEYCGGACASVRRAVGQLSAAGIISSCRKSPQSKKMVYFLEWEGDDDGSGDWIIDDIDPTPPSDPSSDNRITSGSLDDHLNGSLGESPPPEDYSDSVNTKDPLITENQLFQSGETDTEKPEGMIAQEGAEAETQTRQEEQPPDTSDHSKDPPPITPRSTTDHFHKAITKDQLANCRGLSIQQPFATLIPQGLKRYETRGKKTNYRGLVLIHASQKIDKHSFERIVREQDDPALFPTSRVLAVAKLTDCIFMDEAFINEQPDQELFYGLWEPGRWAWKLENIQPLRQTVTGVGALGLWKPNDLLIESLVGVELCDRVDVNNDLYENVPETVNLIQGLLDIEGGRPWAMLRNVEGLSKRQRDEILRRLDVAGRGYQIIWDANNPEWGVLDPSLIKRGELIDFRPFPNMPHSLYAYCQYDDGLTDYCDVFDETFHQDDRREIPKLPDREKAEAKQKAFEKVMKALGEHERPGDEPVTDDEAPGVEPVTDDEASGVEPVTDDEAPGVEPVTDDEAPGAEPVTDDEPADIFDQIQVGDRLNSGYNTSTCICIKKLLKPRRIKVKWLGSGRIVTDLCEESVNVMRLRVKVRLKPGLRIRYQQWYGRLSSQLKSGKWYVNWEGFPSQGLRKKYGEPPKSAIAPQDFEVVE